MITLLIKLLTAHFLADYPLQGDFLSKAKNRKNPIPGVPFYQALFAHSFIQAGFVYLITGSLLCFGIELVIHCVIDYAKCEGKITFNQDQSHHLFCKVIYVAIIQMI